jgi:hypothetical protein
LIAPFLYSILQVYFQEKESKVVVAELTSTLERAGLEIPDLDSTAEIVERLKKERARNRLKVDTLAEDEKSPLLELQRISNKISRSTKIDVRDFRVTESLISMKAETGSVEMANAIAKNLQEIYPGAKTGSVSSCGKDKPNCQEFMIELPRGETP